MDILRSIGVDGTILWHVICFLVSYISLKYLVFDPYAAAYQARIKLTAGTEEMAAELVKKAEDLQASYSKTATLNNEYLSKEFENRRAEAKESINTILLEAKKQSQTQLDQARKTIEKSVTEAASELKSQIPQLSRELSQKLLGREARL